MTLRRITEKITQIRVYNGNKFKAVDQVHAGELFAVTGLTNASIGDGFGVLQRKSDIRYDSYIKIESHFR